MNTNIIIIELSDIDAREVLRLVENEAKSGDLWARYWIGLAEKIKSCMEAQQAGRFFQCAACTDTDQ